MKKLWTGIAASLMLMSATFALKAQVDSGLPTIERNGTTYYFYTVKGDESVFGLLSRFGWDEEVFFTTNPGAAGMKKGEILYYPVVTSPAKPEATQAAHTPESADKQAAHPMPAPAPEAPLAPPPAAPLAPAPAPDAPAVAPAPSPLASAMPGKAYTYTVKQGDSLYSIARENSTSIARLFKENPGLTEADFKPGMELKITPFRPGSDMADVTVTEKKVIGTRTHKASETDTWQSISTETSIPLDILLSVNDTTKALKKGSKVKIPLLADTTFTARRRIIDSREENLSGRTLIYNEVHGLPLASPLDITLLTSINPDNKNRDMEFVRGFLLALNEMKSAGYPVSLHVRAMDPAAVSVSALERDSILPSTNMIITTFENFPEALAKFGDDAGKLVVNVFDAKSDYFTSSPAVMNVLTPSADFYSHCADYLLAAKHDAKYIFIAEDEADGECISLVLLERLIRDGLNYETIPSYSDLPGYNFETGKEYVVVSDLNKRADITSLLTEAGKLNTSGKAQISVVGRPTWVVYAEVLVEKLRNADTYIPSRFFLNSEEAGVQNFDKQYLDAFKSSPVKSFPNYAVMGYDMARYFINQLKDNGGDINQAGSSTDALQLDIRPERAKPWTGLVNENVYLLHFAPYGSTDKIRL